MKKRFCQAYGAESLPRIFSTYEKLGDTGVKCKVKIRSNYRDYLRKKEMTKENKEKTDITINHVKRRKHVKLT